MPEWSNGTDSRSVGLVPTGVRILPPALLKMIRPFKNEDADACRAIIRECFKVDEESLDLGPNAVVKHYTQPTYLENKAKQYPFFVYEEDGKVIAMGAVDGHQIKKMYVHPEFQRQGTGTEILQKLEEIAINSGRVRLLLNAAEGSRDFYKKHGYGFIGLYIYPQVRTFQMIKELE